MAKANGAGSLINGLAKASGTNGAGSLINGLAKANGAGSLINGLAKASGTSGAGSLINGLAKASGTSGAGSLINGLAKASGPNGAGSLISDLAKSNGAGGLAMASAINKSINNIPGARVMTNVADNVADSVIKNPTETALATVSVMNKMNPNPIYKVIINALLDRFVGNTKYLVNAFNMQPNKIDVVCIINFDKDNKNKNAIKILPYYIKLCRIIKTYYNKIIIKSNLLLDESLSIADIDIRAHFMHKRQHLYKEHTNTDHTQDLIDLLNDIEVRTKIDNLHGNLPKNIGNMSGGAIQMISNLISNNDSIHNIIEELFNDKIGVTKSFCPVEIKHCQDDAQQPLPDITGKQYLILDIIYTIYTDKHEIYTKRTKDNPDQCILVAKYNNLDNSKPGIYALARTEMPGGMPSMPSM